MTATAMLNLRDDPQIVAMDVRRGHRFQPPDADLARVPSLYATEHVPVPDKTLWLHFFAGPADWWVAELDSTVLRAFGPVNLGHGVEWGYFDLAELAMATIPLPFTGYGLRVPVERDLYWTPGPASEVLP